LIAAVWDRYEANAVWVEQESYLLCYAAKWLDGPMIVKSLPDFSEYKKDPTNDLPLVKSLWKLLDEADIVIAHNADQFDVKKANARFSHHNLPPPRPYKTIDTLKVARSLFKFSSNKLADLGEHLGLGEKIKVDGHLWRACMAGDETAWRKMITYNKRDVTLLQKIYLHFRPWIKFHPNMSILADKPDGCPNCGSEKIQSRGSGATRFGVYMRFQCMTCGAWSKSTSRKVTNIA
jgi:hypothetical protein